MIIYSKLVKFVLLLSLCSASFSSVAIGVTFGQWVDLSKGDPDSGRLFFWGVEAGLSSAAIESYCHDQYNQLNLGQKFDEMYDWARQPAQQKFKDFPAGILMVKFIQAKYPPCR